MLLLIVTRTPSHKCCAHAAFHARIVFIQAGMYAYAWECVLTHGNVCKHAYNNPPGGSVVLLADASVVEDPGARAPGDSDMVRSARTSAYGSSSATDAAYLPRGTQELSTTHVCITGNTTQAIPWHGRTEYPM